MLGALNSGGTSRNHIEQMALNMSLLVRAVLPHADLGGHPVDSPKFLTRMRAAASIAWENLGEDLFEAASEWESDTARGWAAFAVPLTGASLDAQLSLTRPFAADGHFAVREWAWLGLRPSVTKNLDLSVKRLGDWANSRDPYVRRFAVEVTRPRGVWSTHIPALKANPGAGLPILRNVVLDTDRYVQDSVGNWLNDARKSQPLWVSRQLASWQSEYGADRLAYVTRRALREAA